MKRPTRRPDFVVRRATGEPYLNRWWLIPRNRWFNVYLHEFLGSDEDRALHDHPWFNLSILLFGQYTEVTIQNGGTEKRVVRRAGALKLRSPWAAHRIEIAQPCWTLFLTGPVVRTWGFHCRKGFVPWKRFVSERDSGAVGAGCGEFD